MTNPLSSDGRVLVAGLRWTPWPTLHLPTEQDAEAFIRKHGREAFGEYWQRRERHIELEQGDPLQSGWESTPTGIVRQLLAGTYQPGCIGQATHAGSTRGPFLPANDILNLGGNGSGKTDILAKLGMETLTSGPKREVRFWSQNERTSIRYQQPAIFRYLPPALRKVKKQGQTTKISYNESTGFSEGIFILPNHSAGLLLTYKSWEQDRSSAEGGEAHRVIYDEEAPGELVETLRFRAHKTGGQVLGAFTPTQGYADTVAQYIEGADILETIPARRVVWDWKTGTPRWGAWILDEHRVLVPGCPPGHVPLVLRSGQGGGRRYVVMFPTPFNPYTNVEAIISGAVGKSLEFSLERLYGWPTRRAAKAFPKFGDIHIVKPDRVPKPADLTLYQFTDPHGQRNWFSLWIGVAVDGTAYVMKEWPPAEYGEWTLPGEKPDGKVGPAQRYESGKAFNDYKRAFLQAEGWQREERSHGTIAMTRPKGGEVLEIQERRMDPRPAGTSVPSDEESKTYLDYMQEPVMGKDGAVMVPGLDFMAADHCGLEDGTQLINNWLIDGWDDQQPTSPLNCPKLYVSTDCPNLIYSLRTWTGLDGEKGASKDPIDCLKGAAKQGLVYYGKDYKWPEGEGWR